MPKRSSKDHDFATIARNVVEQAIGEKLDGSPLEDADKGKDARAVKRGKLGGIIGGKKRAEGLSDEEKRAIARKGAIARWKR